MENCSKAWEAENVLFVCSSPVQYSEMQPIIHGETMFSLWEDGVGLAFIFLSLQVSGMHLDIILREGEETDRVQI